MHTVTRLLCALAAVCAATSAVATAQQPPFGPGALRIDSFAPRVEWITSSPWTDGYRPPLAELRAGVSEDTVKYGPGRWTALALPTPDPEEPLKPDEPFIPDPPPDEPSEPLFLWFTDPDAEIGLIYRVPNPTGIPLGAYSWKYSNQSEFAIAIKADGSYDPEWIEICWYRADAIVTYDPEKDFGTGPKVDHISKVTNARVLYTFFPDEPDIDELKGLFVTFGGGWMDEHVLSGQPSGFERPDFSAGLQMIGGFGFMLPLGGPVLELRLMFDMIMISENFMHVWFSASIWI